jgi:hypothetical protein
VAAVRAGTALRSRPDVTAEVLVRIPAAVDLPILDREGDWVKTHFGDWTGWLAPGGEEHAVGPSLDSLSLSPLVLDTSVAERAARVAEARTLLGDENPAASSLGPWPLFTDVTDADLLARLGRIAARLPAMYEERFGLVPSLEEAPAVVLFAREADYRQFTRAYTVVGEMHGDGHANDSMAALFAGADLDVVAGVLVHELTHLLNRRRFTAPPRTWLEEGLANDLGLSRVEEDGALRLGTLTGTVTTVTHRDRSRRETVDMTISGGLGSWVQLLRAWEQRRRDRSSLSAVLDMDWSDFVTDDQRSWHYAQSTFFVRYLLDAAPASRRAAFLEFLRRTADGGPSGATALAEALGESPERLQRDFERWLTTSLVKATQGP